ncbi:mucin-5AC-like [Asterias rubens]|uniref:mucin-5AC-like n=1 Tax=Asterias rubens TaxID=7604 RepID=UPI001455B28F|nr:mucin-5AC-like [Asterias rubens]
MESREKCQHIEPEVGLLLDLDSPVIQKPSSDTSLPPANGKPNEELANQPQGDCDVSGSDPPRAEMIAGEKRSSKSSTEKSSLGSASLESPNWPDFTDEHLIDSEQFDFDLPVSPVQRSKAVDVDDEDEVFFGPVGFTESCVAKKTQLNSQSPIDDNKPMSPLNVEQYLELFLEANKVAMELTKRDERSGSSVADETEKDKEASDAETQRSDPGTKSVIQEDAHDKVGQLPQKPAAKDFKLLVKKEIRSPRRGTYVVAVTPAGTPPPQHLPSADECVSKLAQDKPKVMQFNAAGSKESQIKKESKLPVRGLRKLSKLPMTAGLKKATIPQPSTVTSTDKLLRKKIYSPPKRKRLNSCESEDISEGGSSVKSETFEAPIPHLGIPKGKRPILGNLNLKDKSGVGSSGQPVSGSTDAKATATNVPKAPVTKPSLLQQGSLNRRVVQANRSLKLVKPGQHGSMVLAKKPQPVKAVAKGAKVASTEETPKKTVTAASTTKQMTRLQPQTPSTPIHQAKKSLPKRILSSEMSAGKPTPRSLSASSVPTPHAKIPPSTPSRSDSKAIPASAGSARRRSGLPTPSRLRTFASTSRSSTSSVISNPSPIKFRLSRTSTTSSSPSTTPHPPKPSHASTEGAIQLELDSSPVYIKETQQVSVRPALETKTNSLGVDKSSPGIGLLVDFSHESPAEKLPKAVVRQANTRIDKENLIDLL